MRQQRFLHTSCHANTSLLSGFSSGAADDCPCVTEAEWQHCGLVTSDQRSNVSINLHFSLSPDVLAALTGHCLTINVLEKRFFVAAMAKMLMFDDVHVVEGANDGVH